MSSPDALSLNGLYEDKVTWLGKERTNADIIKVHEESFKKDPAQWTLFDTCTLAVDHPAGSAPASIAYGIESIDAQAMPTPTIVTSRMFLSCMK